MPDAIKLIGGDGRVIEIPVTEETREKPGAFSRKDDLIVSIRVAAMHIYTRADKYVDELTDPENTFISIEFDENGVPSVSVNKTEHVVTPEHVENSLDIKQLWREEDC